jgi:hypothetical protein
LIESENPLFYITLAKIIKTDDFTYGRESPAGSNSNQLGFQIETEKTETRFIVSSFTERENWLTALQNAYYLATENIIPDSTERAAVPVAVTLFAEMFLFDPCKQGVKKWTKRIVSLDEDGFIHFYADDMEKFLKEGVNPMESMNLSTAISVRLCDVATGISSFLIF